MASSDAEGRERESGFKPGMFWGTLIALVEFLGGIAPDLEPVAQGRPSCTKDP
jgi:hypothetical protein